MKVRELEERLIQARADLVEARLGARHVEAAECRARQALDGLPGPRTELGADRFDRFARRDPTHAQVSALTAQVGPGVIGIWGSMR